MDRHIDLSALNAQWSKDDEQWAHEIERWTQLTRQWTALLYLIDRNLPEQTSALEQHKTDIEKHTLNLIRFRCGIDEHCIPTCPDHITQDKLCKAYDELAEAHQNVGLVHMAMKQDFEKKKHELIELAQRLLDLLNED